MQEVQGNDPPDTGDPHTGDLVRSVHEWMAGWGAEVAGVDMVGARHRFSGDVVGFGTHAAIVHGLDQLEADQWSNVWPTIDGFTFRLDELVVISAPDRCQAVAVVPWDSFGFDAEGSRFPRPGRATVVLSRASTTDPWFGVHTHFSLVPPAGR